VEETTDTDNQKIVLQSVGLCPATADRPKSCPYLAYCHHGWIEVESLADAHIEPMKLWLEDYQKAQTAAHQSIPLDAVARLIQLLTGALKEDRQIFVFGNGGSAANCSHFATDLGKGASDKVGRRFRILSLNDNTPWMMAIANDYCYDDIFWRQLENYGKPGDIAMSLSVSGNSPNCVKALEWAKQNGLVTVALVGGRKGRMAEIADHALVIDDIHYGRVEDAQMTICHMLCYAFMENPEAAGSALPHKP